MRNIFNCHVLKRRINLDYKIKIKYRELSFNVFKKRLNINCFAFFFLLNLFNVQITLINIC